MSDYSTYEEELQKNGKIIHTNVGTSMMPLLRQNRDVMIIERPEGRLKKYDVPLYKRKNGQYVLHRILKVREKDYVICGDHCVKKEYGITDVDAVYRDPWIKQREIYAKRFQILLIDQKIHVEGVKIVKRRRQSGNAQRRCTKSRATLKKFGHFGKIVEKCRYSKSVSLGIGVQLP